MKLRSLYILSIVGLLLVIVVQIGGMMYEMCIRDRNYTIRKDALCQC